jgi:hypothetical protein
VEDDSLDKETMSVNALNAQFSNLSELQPFHLANSDFIAQIRTEVGVMTKFAELDLRMNR